MYNSITAKLKPPPRLALLHYLNAYDPEMAYQIRERNPMKLEDMQNNAVSVEANMLEKKSKMKAEKKSNNKRRSHYFC